MKLRPAILVFISFILAISHSIGHGAQGIERLPDRPLQVNLMSTEALKAELLIQQIRSREYQRGRRTFGLPAGVSPFDEVGNLRVFFRMIDINDELSQRCSDLIQI